MIRIEDGSLYGGRIDVKLSHDSSINVSATFVLLIFCSQSQPHEVLYDIHSEHEYVRTTGRLRTRSGFTFLSADYIRPIEHPHEVDFHILEVLFVNMVLKRGYPVSIPVAVTIFVIS
jgi:hypothetical protein